MHFSSPMNEVAGVSITLNIFFCMLVMIIYVCASLTSIQAKHELELIKFTEAKNWVKINASG
ncbi:MAG: hypothetical protein CTY12_04620 [Methylotenera sp.]|nr:MAG: hypothetical protein CTY12_04620 [Methylotenera sp.]